MQDTNHKPSLKNKLLYKILKRKHGRWLMKKHLRFQIAFYNFKRTKIGRKIAPILDFPKQLLNTVLQAIKRNKKKILLTSFVLFVIASVSFIAIRQYLSDPTRIAADYQAAAQEASNLSDQLRPLQAFAVDPQSDVSVYADQINSVSTTIEETSVHNPGRTGLSIYLEGSEDKEFELNRLKNNDLEKLKKTTQTRTQAYASIIASLEPVFTYSTDELSQSSANFDTTKHFTQATDTFRGAQSSFSESLAAQNASQLAQNKQMQEISEVLDRIINEASTQKQSANIELWQRAIRDYKIEIATQLNFYWGEFYANAAEKLSEHRSDYLRVYGLVKQNNQ